MDKLLALRMFVETVKCGGYTAAARKLGIATSSVTRLVAGLESELGAALLNRTTRQISVTSAGQAYFDKAMKILHTLEEADASVADRGCEAKGSLRVSVPVEFGRRIIAPHLGRFLDQHPCLDIKLMLSDELCDLLSEQIDVSVRLGSTVVSQDVISRPIGVFQRWLVASPGYLEKTFVPVHPQELSDHLCLKFDYSGAHQHWTFKQSGETHIVEVRGRLQSNNADVLREAAVAGGGVALIADWLVRQDVAEGRLTRLLPDFEANPGLASSGINALYLPNHRGSSRIGAFLAFLDEVLREQL